MHLRLEAVRISQKEILRNLLEKYDYEFSQYDGRDVNELGLYGYDYLDNYWTEKNRWAFFIYADDKLAGFVMINDYPECGKKTDFTLSEFFVMHKYRRMGVGRFAAFEVFDRFKGSWQLKRHPKNLPSVAFWDRIVSDYTGGSYTLIRDVQEAAYDDGTPADLIFFNT